MRLGPESLGELKGRIRALLEEYIDRNELGGEPLSYLWSVAARPSGP